LNRAFQNHGNFSSGVGVQYAPSAVTYPLHQATAENLVIGQRLLPHVLVRAADAREINIQDLAPSDSRFKLFVFPGEHADKVASFLERPDGFFNKRRDAYSVITVMRGDKTTVNHLAVPPVLRPHWTK
jgi:phenol 2-monooxygenase